MIDVIIPAYSPSTVIRIGLMSLITQFHRELLNIILVNDCSPNTENNYQDLIEEFQDIVKIQCLKTPKNCGQGLARQYGIDHSYNDYFTFMDDDDQLGSNFAIFNLITTIQVSEQKHPNKKCAFSAMPICNLHNNSITTIDANNSVFVNGKLYCREFINKYNIHFHPNHSFVNEDYYFSHAVYFALYCNTNKWTEARVGDDPYAYFWMNNPNSQSQSQAYRTYLDMSHFAKTSADLVQWMESLPSGKIKNIKQELSFMIAHSFYHCFAWVSKAKEKDPIFNSCFGSEDWERLQTGINELRKLCQQYSLTKEEITPALEQIKKEQDMQGFIQNINIDIMDFIKEGCEELRGQLL